MDRKGLGNVRLMWINILQAVNNIRNHVILPVIFLNQLNQDSSIDKLNIKSYFFFFYWTAIQWVDFTTRSRFHPYYRCTKSYPNVPHDVKTIDRDKNLNQFHTSSLQRFNVSQYASAVQKWLFIYSTRCANTKWKVKGRHNLRNIKRRSEQRHTHTHIHKQKFSIILTGVGNWGNWT